MTLLAALVETSRTTGLTASRLAKVATLAGLLRTLEPGEVATASSFLTGETRQGKIGAGHSLLEDLRAEPAAEAPTLTLADVDKAFAEFTQIRGSGSVAKRSAVLAVLFARATAEEQDFLVRLIVGELRQGALRGLMLEAIATAAEVPLTDVRRAAMYSGGIGPVALAALTGGVTGLARFQLRTLQPVEPMLAHTAENVAQALGQFGEAAFDWKLDGARIQVHKLGDEVRAYTRGLNEVTSAIPEIIETVCNLPVHELVLDGEAIALSSSGAPRPFQITMRRFGRKLDVAALRHELPLSAFFFDLLRHDGVALTDRSARERFIRMSSVLPTSLLIPRLVTNDAAEAEAFLSQALARGHEGVMAKALDAPYEAGNRGASWLKIKQVRTLDLVVLAAEWGSGRRQGWLSNLHLGARDPDTGQFVMLGKTFKGLSDAILDWQTGQFLAREIGRDALTIYIKPELVVEIAFNDVQASPQYPGGVALRFARLKRYRPDKRAEEADTIDTVRSYLVT